MYVPWLYVITSLIPSSLPSDNSAFRRMPFLYLLLFFASNLITTTKGVPMTITNSRIPGCPSFDCGDNVSITYPFWVSQGDNQFCGYPELEITCINDTATFKTLSDDYTVTNISVQTRTFSLFDTDVKFSECPRVRHQVDLSHYPNISYTPKVVNLTFFFNCTPDLPMSLPLPVKCLQDIAGTSYVFVGDVPNRETLSKDCPGGSVVSPVLDTSMGADPTSLITQSFGDVLKSGFELQWKEPEMSNCLSCQRTNGYCGYKNSSEYGGGLDFICLCEDGTQSSYDCTAPTGMSPRKKALIATCSILGFLLLVALGYLFVKRTKNKKRVNSSRAILMRSISSDPSAFNKDPESQNMTSNYLTHIFSYKELEDATDGFSSSREVGDGGFGTVYKGSLRDGRTVAVKRLYENNYKRLEQFMNEVAIVHRLRHPRLVSLYGCTSRHSRELLLVYEYVPNGTVADHLHGSRAEERALTWSARVNIAIETADALAYLHANEPQIIHRDVKTNNILLDNSYHVKVADFGLSREFPLDATHVSTAPQGTPGYVDPEYHQCYQLTDKSDVYSFGVVLVELISSKQAVDITRRRQEINLSNMAINKIREGAIHELADTELGYDADPEVKRMIDAMAEVAFLCLQAEKDARPTMKDVKAMLINIVHGDDNEKTDDGGKQIKDDAYLLNSNVPPSPDTVTMKWYSTTTTPNTSA